MIPDPFETLHVLLVDDDEEDYLLTRAMLDHAKGRKIALDWASSYETGWQKIQSNQYDAVLVDYDLGGRTGIELIQQTVACGFQVPLILYTGRGSYEVDLEAMRAGASLYLAKGEANPLLLERFIRYAIERKQSEALLKERNEALQESEARFRDLADNFQTIIQYAPAAIYEVDFLGRRFTSVNDVMCNMTGYSQGELLQMDPFDLLDESGKALFQDRIDRWQAGEKPAENVEYTIKTRDGHTVCVLLNSTFLFDEKGKPHKATVIGFDITARKRVEQELAADLAAMELLHNVSTHFTEDGDEASILQAVLEAAIEIAGADMGNIQILDTENKMLSIVAQRGFEAPFLEYFAQTDLDEPSACREASMRRERVMVEDVENSPIFSEAPSLDVLKAAGVRAIQSTPLLSRKGHLVGILSTHWREVHRPEARTLRLIDLLARQAADLTARKRVEEALRESEERFRAMADGTPMIIWVTDANGRIEFINRAYSNFFGVTLEQVRSEGWKPLVHPEDQSSYVEVFIGCMNQRRKFHAEGRVREKGGEWRWIVSYGQPRFSPSGEFLGMAGSSFDITDRKDMEKSLQTYTEQLKHSNLELENFAFMASHDMQEPLRKIENFGRLLAQRAGPGLGETERDYLDRMQGAANRMRNMIEDLLALSKITSQGQSFQRLDLNRVARAVVEDLEDRIRQNGAQIELGNLGEIQADPVQMHQLFQNLIGNAIKFHKTGEPHWVKVQSCALPGERIEITIEDNGIGFDQVQVDQLFQPFYRLHSRSVYEGTGIGLSICQKIVERHGGSITARGEPGCGSTFIVTLPENQPG